MAESGDRWQVYVIRLADNTFYTGISTDVVRRLDAHRRGRGARYTRGRGPIELWWTSDPLDHGQALRLERRIKKMAHGAKALLRPATVGREASDPGFE